MAKSYHEGLCDLGLEVPGVREGATHVFHLYVVRSQRRELLIRFLREKEVGALVHYPVPVHRQPAYQQCRVGEGGLMETERAAQEIVSLPI